MQTHHLLKRLLPLALLFAATSPLPAAVSGSKNTSVRTTSSAAKAPRGGNTSQAQNGKAEHRRFQQDFGSKAGRGAERRMSSIEYQRGTIATPRKPGEAGRGARLDLATKSGRPVELKPDTASGRKAMESQIRQYERNTGRRGIRAYYDQTGGRRFERTPYSEWKTRAEVRSRPGERPARVRWMP